MSNAQQKPSTEQNNDDRYALLDRTINKFQRRGDALIEVLHAAQSIFGFLDKETLLYVAKALRRPLSQVYGVATFYHLFRLKPNADHTFVLCTGTACYLKGAPLIQSKIEKECSLKFGETTPDRKLSLLSVRCVGTCGLAPLAFLDDDVAGYLTPDEAFRRLNVCRNKS